MHVAIVLIDLTPARTVVRGTLLDAVQAAVDMVPIWAVKRPDETYDEARSRVAQILTVESTFTHDDSTFVVGFVEDPDWYIAEIAEEALTCTLL